jgi:SAM-dependent methyltransferase
MNYTTALKCRSCGSDKLKEVLSLGEQKIVEFTSKPVSVPLELIKCETCELVQLRHTTNPDLLWNEGYGYRSGVNDAMVKHLHGIAHEAEKYLKDGDTVLDIGCNDGSLLEGYTKDLMLVGIDPSRNVAQYAGDTLEGKKHSIIYDFFNKEAVNGYKLNVITAISMFYDLDDPNKFLEDIKDCLVENGVLVIQQNYLGSMIKNCAFDNICHEHVEYYSLTSLLMLLNRHGLTVFKVEENDLNGGSIRTYICRLGERPLESSVKELFNKEHDIDVYGFGERMEKIIESIHDVVMDIHEKGHTIYAYGASTRGGTLLQACKLGKDVITKAVERNADKWGKVMQATGIPIISEQQARNENPDYMIILPWFFADAFMEREKEYSFHGGKWIIPLPRPRIV